jgi:hypothetical protein
MDTCIHRKYHGMMATESITDPGRDPSLFFLLGLPVPLVSKDFRFTAVATSATEGPTNNKIMYMSNTSS